MANSEINENPQIKITGHLIIRDPISGKIILNKRDESVNSISDQTGGDHARKE
jgi:hypothetical protein